MPDTNRLKGVGLVTAAGLIGEVGDFRKFGTISEIMKLVGLDLYEVSSGKHKGKLSFIRFLSGKNGSSRSPGQERRGEDGERPYALQYFKIFSVTSVVMI